MQENSLVYQMLQLECYWELQECAGSIISGVSSAIGSAVSNNNSIISDPKFYKLQSWCYLGLHHDAIGDAEKLKYCMKNAALQACNESTNGGNIAKCLPLLHVSRRDWFEDEEDLMKTIMKMKIVLITCLLTMIAKLCLAC